MSDFEERVRRGLAAGARQAPTSHGLVAGARARAAARRRRRRVGWAAALVAVLVPAVLWWGAARDDPRAVDPVDSSVPQGWRLEYHDGLEVAVPRDWGLGECPRPGKGETGAVMREFAGVDPSCAFVSGLRFVEIGDQRERRVSGEVWETKEPTSGADSAVRSVWRGVWYDEDRMVVVSSADRRTTQQVVDSVRVLDGWAAGDRYSVELQTPSGCPTISASEGKVIPVLALAGPVAVCRYTSVPNGVVSGVPALDESLDLYLSQALVLDDAEAGRLRRAYVSAPRAQTRMCFRTAGDVVLVLVGDVVVYRLRQPCGTDLFEGADGARILTSQARAALQLPTLDLTPKR